MAEVKQELRDIEAAWLRDQMKIRGLTHTELHELLSKVGFSGQLNNVTMWTTARTSIPNEWLGKLIKILTPKVADSVALEMYSRRMPYLRSYLRPVSQTFSPVHDNEMPTNGVLPSSGSKVGAPARIYYIAKYGKHKGDCFVPHKNRRGKYQGGISRFKHDVEEFDSIEDLWERVNSDPEFKIRMSPEDAPGPASLISRDSLLFEWDD